METEQVRKDLAYDPADFLAKAAVAYHNEKHKKDEHRMEFESIKEAYYTTLFDNFIFFINFEANFFPKGGETKRTDCRAMLFGNKSSGYLEVHSVKHGSLNVKELEEWIKTQHVKLLVLFSEPKEQESKEVLPKEDTKPGPPERPPPASFENETDLENQLPMEVAQAVPFESNKRKREELDSSDDDEPRYVLSDDDEPMYVISDDDEPRYGEESSRCWSLVDYDVLNKGDIRAVEEYVDIAVTYYNNKKENKDTIKLMKITEALFEPLGGLSYHINFDGKSTAKVGKGEKEVNCQAVVCDGWRGVEVYAVKVRYPEEETVVGVKASGGKAMDEWCEEGKSCMCGFLSRPMKPMSQMDLLKLRVKELSKWFPSSDDEVEDGNDRKPNSPKKPLPTSIGEETDLEN